jgi:hypothetical protein
MRTFSSLKLVDVWERGLSQRPLQKALTMLSLYDALSEIEAAAELSIGRRDAWLLQLRQDIFGSHFEGLAVCPMCRETLELNFDVRDIKFHGKKPPGRLSVSRDGYHVRFRLPNSLDLEEISDLPADEAKNFLLRSCILEVSRAGKKILYSEMPPEIITAVAEGMEAADPQANILINIDCPSCHHRWQSPFDIVSFLWCELNSRARRLLHEVHCLASAYGWEEEKILEMSPRRRQIYLEKISG